MASGASEVRPCVSRSAEERACFAENQDDFDVCIEAEVTRKADPVQCLKLLTCIPLILNLKFDLN